MKVFMAKGGTSITAKRLRERMTETGTTQEMLAEAIGATQGAISQILTGTSRNSRLLPKIAKNQAVNLNWLLGLTDNKIDMFDAEGEQIDEDTLAAILAGHIERKLVKPDQVEREKRHSLFASVTQPEVPSHTVMIPQLEIGFSMGGGSVFEEYHQTAMVPFPRAWLAPLMAGGFTDLFVARGEGDSMVPTLLDGDLVIVDTAQKQIRQQDRLWCLSYGDLGMIKRCRVLPDGGVQVNSDNPAVSPFTAHEEEMHVIGRVIWIGRRV